MFWLHFRRDLARTVTLLDMIKRREKLKREQLNLTIEVIEKRYQAKDFSAQLVNELTNNATKTARYAGTCGKASTDRVQQINNDSFCISRHTPGPPLRRSTPTNIRPWRVVRGRMLVVLQRSVLAVDICRPVVLPRSTMAVRVAAVSVTTKA